VKLIVLLSILALSLCCYNLLACGPFFEETIFTYTIHPDFPLSDFAKGNVGIILPSYARSYLFVAYHYFSRAGLNQNEQQAMVSLWDERLNFSWRIDGSEWIKTWLDARGKVSQAGTTPEISIYSAVAKDSYNDYLNYTQDAFITASKTLNERIEKFGADSQIVINWVKAQDMVFSNSMNSGFMSDDQKKDYTPLIPDPIEANADPLAKADRNYQIACANFYAKNFDTAIGLFKEIANDKSSPWSKIAPYLVGRTLVRQATLSAKPEEVDIDLLAQAQEEINNILSNKNMADLYPSARRHLGFINFRLDPEGVLHDLANQIIKTQGEDLKQKIDDYTKCLDIYLGKYRYIDESDMQKNNSVYFTELSGIMEEDVTDWIATLQFDGEIWLSHAMKKWKATSSLPWLVAVLSKINTDDPNLPEVIKSADKVKPDSPAYPSVIFHKLRLIAESGEEDKARAELDFVLKDYGESLPKSAYNLMLALRLRLASDLDEFLEFAPRVPAGISVDMDGMEIPDSLENNKELADYVNNRSFIDIDSTRILNEHIPISVLREICTKKAFPESIRQELTRAVWVRAILLDDEKIVKEISPILIELAPELKEYVSAYLSEKDKESRKFAAVYTMLKFPGLRPFIDSGMGRMTALDKIDSYRDNWWNSFKPAEGEAGESVNISIPELFKSIYPEGEFNSPSFLTPAQETTMEQEWQKMQGIDTAPNYLCAIVIDRAGKNISDPRVPEALHLAVRSTRYGATDDKTTGFSKQAFQLLHKNYPKSEWAGKTKYWF
jgi:hypothetical protein